MDETQNEMIVIQILVEVSSLHLCGCNQRNGGDVL